MAPSLPECCPSMDLLARKDFWIVSKSSSACAQARPYATSRSVSANMCGTPYRSLTMSIFDGSKGSCKAGFLISEGNVVENFLPRPGFCEETATEEQQRIKTTHNYSMTTNHLQAHSCGSTP